MDSEISGTAHSWIPTDKEKRIIFCRSSKRWQTCVQEATSRTLLPCRSLSLNGALRGVPDFGKIRHMLSRSAGNQLFAECRSAWRVGRSPCDRTDLELVDNILLGVSVPVISTFDDNTEFETWPGVEGYSAQPEVKSNYIATLAYCWTYIISARWAELQNGQCQYLASQAPVHQQITPHTSHHHVRIDNATPAEARWWSAVLAPGRGWSAVISTKSQDYMSPLVNSDQ